LNEGGPPIFIFNHRPAHGLAIGSYSTDHFYGKWIRRYQTHSAFDAVNDRLTALNALHAGDTNGTVEILESQLDNQLLVLGAMLQNMPAGQMQPQTIRLLTQLRDYRAAHPRKTGRPEVDQIVAKILSPTNSLTHQ
jgi:hypothetical protein